MFGITAKSVPGEYRLTLIRCRNRNWLHVGSSPTSPTKIMNCKNCGNQINRQQAKYCSVECYRKAKAKRYYRRHNIGYLRVYCPTHPKANTWGYVYEHRLIIEQKLRRTLSENEVVHHKNGKRWDNRLENLEVMQATDHCRLKRENKKNHK